tara:strand:+ start:313 stop:576 length:264 start_codon:yes stop_codon:yes gene_type:complete
MIHICGVEILGWNNVDNLYMEKEFKFADFKSALEFVNLAGEICEKQDHHADFELSWGKVVIRTWTHSENKITELDYKLIDEIDKIGV